MLNFQITIRRMRGRTTKLEDRKRSRKSLLRFKKLLGTPCFIWIITVPTVLSVKVNALSDRLDKMAAQLDRTGPSTVTLREATLKRLDDDLKAFVNMSKGRTESPSLRPSIADITNPAVDRYFSASGSVMSKAGLLTPANGNPPAKPPESKAPSEFTTNLNTSP